MPATTVSLTRLNGFPQFHCFHCGAEIFGQDGPAEDFCGHVRVFVDWIGEPILGGAATGDLEAKLEEIAADVPEELAGLFDENTIVFELVEQARGGGHDGDVCLVALAVDGFENDRDDE